MKILTFIGIITNTSITFFEVDYFKDSQYKWYFFIGFENFLVFLFFIISYDSLPSWFKFLKQIRFEYVTRVHDSEYKKNTKLDGNKIDNTIMGGIYFKEEVEIIKEVKPHNLQDEEN